MASPTQPAKQPSSRGRSGGRLHNFWQRVTDGFALNELWDQFRVETRTSYRLYTREIVASPRREETKRGVLWWTKQFFWAIMEKLSPARRVLLLLALFLLLYHPDVSFTTKNSSHAFTFDMRVWGGLLMFFLLILEIADRVVMKRDLQIAREIQILLLPSQAPDVPGVEIAFLTRPANTVAGDYYDVFPRPVAGVSADPTYLIAVADVVGKSIPAALLMASLQTSLKILAAAPSSLDQLVAGMNNHACSNSQGGLRFTTAFFAEYEPATRALTYVNAGHNWPIVRHNDGRIEWLDRGGLPLGVESDALYQTGAAHLETGAWLVVFTDGVVEAINDRETEYGVDRFVSVINAGANASPAQMLGRIMADLSAFVGNQPQHDDITCLLMKAV
jgi:sigma-B regulation protein RsbU (phosphoserine phosphatase)